MAVTPPPQEDRYKGYPVLSFLPLNDGYKEKPFSAGVKKWARALEHIDSVVEFVVEHGQDEDVESLMQFVHMMDNSPAILAAREMVSKLRPATPAE